MSVTASETSAAGDRGASQRGVATLLALWLAFAACAAGWMWGQRQVDRNRDRWPQSYPLLFLPSGQYLRASSLGFRVVMADLVYLWSIQYYGHHRTVEGRQYLWHIFEVITELDPRFTDAYLTGSLIMAADMADPELAVDLLDKGIENLPESWILPVSAGFYEYMDIGDYERAAAYFRQAMELPGAPAWVERLHAHMYEMAGDLEQSLLFWASIHEGSEDESVRAIAYQHVYDLRVKIDIRRLEELVARFTDERGRRPRSLDELLRAGFLRFVPANPNGTPYDYDAATGEVTDPDAGQRRGQGR